MHEAALSRAAQPAPVVVMGMLLRPLSIWHVLTLQRDGVLTARTITPEQLTGAVLTCCQSWAQSSSMAMDPILSIKLWIWSRRIARAAKSHTKRYKAGAELAGYFETETEKFNRYLVEGSIEFPCSNVDRPDRSAPSRQPGCPFILRLHLWLVTTLRLSSVDAWDHPFGLAKMLWACHWEIEGGLEILNGKENSFEEYVNQQESLAGRGPMFHRNSTN